MLKSILGVEWPLIQAPMAGVQDARLAAAVCNAGGLGSLPCAMIGLDDLSNQLQLLRSLTDKPINVNFFAHKAPVFDVGKDAEWRNWVASHATPWGLPKPEPAVMPLRNAFNFQMLQVLTRFRPEVVSFHFGLPDEDLLSPLRAWGAKIVSTATTVDEALWLQSHGVDAIIVQGLEAGGHRGHFLKSDLDLRDQMNLPTLLPAIVQALAQSKQKIPVIAAGGIATADDVAAAIAMGAQGVQVGTAFLLSDEATTGAVHRAAIASVAGQTMDDVTALTNAFTGRPARGIINEWMRAVASQFGQGQIPANRQGCDNLGEGLHPDVPDFPLAANAIAPLRAAVEKAGSSDYSPLWAGRCVQACEALPAAQITQRLLQGFASMAG